MTLTLDLPPAEEAELRRLAAAGDLPAVRAALSDRLDDLAAGLTPAAPAAFDAVDSEVTRRVEELLNATAGFAADFPADYRPPTNEQLRRESIYDD